jgi:hypothetical protein
MSGDRARSGAPGHRTNVWDYVSQNALSGTAKGKLALHPTGSTRSAAPHIRSATATAVISADLGCPWRDRQAD